MTSRSALRTMAGITLVGLSSSACWGVPCPAGLDDPPAPPGEPSKEPAKAPTRDDEPPGLDELLGISPKTRAQLALPDTTKADLDKRLSGEQIGDLFESAVTLMGEASRRMSAALEAARAKAAGDAPRSPEAWLQTQRMQEDVVRKLDAMIAELEKQGSSQSSKSSKQQQEPNQPQQQRTSSQKRTNKPGGDGQTDHDPPQGRPGEMRPDVEAARAAWGALPERVRDMLQQGSGDKYSSLYERLTADYYKRLAEQGRTRGGANGGGGSGGAGDRKP